MDVCEEDLRLGERRVEAKGVESAAFGLGELAEQELHQAETILPDGGAGCGDQATVNERLGLGEFGAAVKHHGQSEEGGSEPAVGEIDGFLEVDGAVIELAEIRFCEADVVVTAVVVGRETGDRAEIGRLAWASPLRRRVVPGAFFESFDGLGRQRELLDRDHRRIGRNSRLSGSERGIEECWRSKKREECECFHGTPPDHC